MPARKAQPFRINDTSIAPGQMCRMTISLARLYDYTPLAMPVTVIHGQQAGPTMFVSAAIHGDEICGVEITRRLMTSPALRNMRGTLLIVPIVNVFGFNHKSRYLPDRRDLNRSFPGNRRGSLASHVAYVFMNKIVKLCSHGIDLHSGSLHRENLPQIRAHLKDPEVRRMARAFGAPVMLDANIRDGSLRQSAMEHDVKILLYEGGEALRFDEPSIHAGVHGILATMQAIGMIRNRLVRKSESALASSSVWLRAPQSGILSTSIKLGQKVSRGDILGAIADAYGDNSVPVSAECNGMIIGRITIPLVNRGDALFHLATFDKSLKFKESQSVLQDIDLNQFT